MTTWTTEDLENARKKIEEDEYSGGIPIPFAGWMQQDKDDTEEMLRHQLQIMQAEIEALKAKTLTDEEIMVLYEEYIETQYASESNVLGFGRAILKKASEK
jgi:HAMP domain-containing protein